MPAELKVEKALIVDHPWIDKILNGTKTWEMRSKPAYCRSLFGLIAKGSGKVQGVARITEVGEPLTEAEMIETIRHHQIPEYMIRSGQVSKWTFPWKLTDVRRLSRAVPYAHKSGAIQWVKLAPDVCAAIGAQLSD